MAFFFLRESKCGWDEVSVKKISYHNMKFQAIRSGGFHEM